MPKNNKLAMYLWKRLAEIMLRYKPHALANIMISINQVDLHSDFSKLKVYVSCFPEDIKISEILNSERNIYKKLLYKNVRIGKTPDLEFIDA